MGDNKHHKKGYATEAIQLILNHAFIDLGLERVESKQFINNLVSIKLHEKVGFYKEGVLRNYFLKTVNIMMFLSCL
ncbi:GNAT family N-acetyltransferase [Photobacterium leiognathi]|uniref:GNAT family N-acetyltransferase n=1 Tax=Photobacterium leiognathi TaxID=553611 RepID=UPI0034E97F19